MVFVPISDNQKKIPGFYEGEMKWTRIIIIIVTDHIFHHNKNSTMKKILFAFALLVSGTGLYAQNYRIITTIESIVPGGVGRSRIIDSKDQVDYKQLTTSRDNGKDSDQGSIDRSDAKTDKLEETKLLNFYSFVGINFQNIASNDAIITSKLNDVANEGWELAFVASGVESDAGEKDGKGIFITRYIFKKK